MRPARQTLHIDFLFKGLDLAMPALAAPGAPRGDGANRRLLHTAVERWLKPRAASVKHLVLSFSARDQTHSFAKDGRGLAALLSMLAPTLQARRGRGRRRRLQAGAGGAAAGVSQRRPRAPLLPACLPACRS